MLETQRPEQSGADTAASNGTSARPPRVGWLEDRLQLSALKAKYGRKAFPVHSTFFLGEMAAICFVILGVTGVTSD